MPQKVSRVSKFHRFIVSEKGNERRGFVEEADYRRLAGLTKEPWLRALLPLAYAYGLRKDELLEIKCSQVDLLNNTVSFYSGETKNGEPRIVYLTEECRLLVTELRKGKQPEDFLLTRESGEPVRDLPGTWAAPPKRPVPGLLLHDFRCSAVRDMIRQGVPQKTDREISGHKTDSVFNRYNSWRIGRSRLNSKFIHRCTKSGQCEGCENKREGFIINKLRPVREWRNWQTRKT